MHLRAVKSRKLDVFQSIVKDLSLRDLCVDASQKRQIRGDTGQVGEGWEDGSLSPCCGAPVWVWNEIVVMLPTAMNLLKAAKPDIARG